MRKLGVEPEACLVYEDSEIGMTSARGAGAWKIVDIRNWPQA
jgi:beta-phosphoglucomutase-like phosphatase (HAD superfamily)